MTADTETIREALERLLYIAEHLWQMVPREVWRDSGGDDGQGHYEGDYHAEKIRDELTALSAALAALGRVEERERVQAEHLAVAHREWEKEQARRLELEQYKQAAEVMASYLRIGQERPPEYVLEFFRRIHDLPISLSSAAGDRA